MRNTTGSEKVYGKFSLIDLAGNERGADTANADRRTRWGSYVLKSTTTTAKERALPQPVQH